MKKQFGLQLNGEIEQGELMDLDILVDRDSEGKITSGLLLGNVLQQNQALILISYPGEFKMDPTLGVGFSDLMLDNDYLSYRHRITEHFAKDGLNAKTVDLFPNKPFHLVANYD